MKNNNEVKYAGFWIRAIAWIIDSIILGIPLEFLAKLVDEESTFFIMLMTIVWWIYTAYSISKWYGTPGKRIIGLYVVTPAMERVSFKRATLRYIFSLLAYVPLIVYIRFVSDIEMISEGLVWVFLVVAITPILMMLFQNKRQTLYDYMAKTIVVDRIDYKMEDDAVPQNMKEKNKLSVVQKVIRFIVGLVIIIPVVYGIFYFTVMYIAFYGHGKSSDKPTTSVSKTVEYNNTKIEFYKSELEKASGEFIEADSMYDILEGYTKRDLALNCIGFFLQKEGNKDWLDEMYRYKSNARNKYANTEARVKKAKKNESYLGHHFYDYDLNDVDHIAEEIADMWDVKGNKKTCEQKLPVEDMYVSFLSKYIKNREETKIRWTDDLARENQTDKRFWKKQIEKTAMWIEELYRQNPKYLTEKLEKQKAVDLEVKQIEEEYNKIEFNKKKNQKEQNEIIYKKDLKRGVPPIFAVIQNHLYKKLIELLDDGADIELKNKFGTRPLSFAMYHQDAKIIETLLKYGANPNVIDGNGLYSPLSEACVTNKIKIVKLLLKYGADVNYQYKKSETALTVASKGCRNFELVKLLLDNGANPTLMDTYGYNTLTGLRRYCRDDEAYEDMKSFIERNTL